MYKIENHPILELPKEEFVEFQFEGRTVRGQKGKTIAAALHQAGLIVHSHSTTCSRVSLSLAAISAMRSTPRMSTILSNGRRWRRLVLYSCHMPALAPPARCSRSNNLTLRNRLPVMIFHLRQQVCLIETDARQVVAGIFVYRRGESNGEDLSKYCTALGFTCMGK